MPPRVATRTTNANANTSNSNNAHAAPSSLDSANKDPPAEMPETPAHPNVPARSSTSGPRPPRPIYGSLFNTGLGTPAGSTAFSSFRPGQDTNTSSDIARLASVFERMVGDMLEAFKMERDNMKRQLQAEREKDRGDRESFRADLFSIIDHSASANDLVNDSTTETNVVPPRDPPPHLPAAPPPSTNPQFTVNAEPNPLDDVQKILVSLNQCVEGPAAPWYVTCINSLSSGAWSVKTWNDYKVAFMNTFGDPFITAEGSRLLSSAVQRKDETDRALPLMRFDGYRSMVGQMDAMFDPAMIRMLRERLPPRVVITKVGDHVVNYDKFKAMVIKHDCKIRESERSTKHYEYLRALDAGTISGTPTVYAPASDVLDDDHPYSAASTTVDLPVQ